MARSSTDSLNSFPLIKNFDLLESDSKPNNEYIIIIIYTFYLLPLFISGLKNILLTFLFLYNRQQLSQDPDLYSFIISFVFNIHSHLRLKLNYSYTLWKALWSYVNKTPIFHLNIFVIIYVFRLYWAFRILLLIYRFDI